MTEASKVTFYETLTQNKTVIESSLMENLGVHFNAEVSLKTIKNANEGLEWI